MARLTVGEQFPNLTVDTSEISGTTIAEIAGGKPLMLVMLRYIGCPPCRYDVHMIQLNHERFVQKGVQVAVVMQSTQESIRSAMAGQPLSFPIICDPQSAVYNSVDVVPAADMAELMGDEAARVKFDMKRQLFKAAGFTHGEYEGIEEQLPAFFYLDSDLTVKVAHYAKNIGDMPTVDEMLDM